MGLGCLIVSMSLGEQLLNRDYSAVQDKQSVRSINGYKTYNNFQDGWLTEVCEPARKSLGQDVPTALPRLPPDLDEDATVSGPVRHVFHFCILYIHRAHLCVDCISEQNLCYECNVT